MKALHVLGIFVSATISLYGADADPVKFFKLDFAVKELDAGKVISSHTYSIRAATGQPGGTSIRTVSKVPSMVSSSGQLTYLEVGINFDVRHFKEADGDVSLELVADISSIAEDPTALAKSPIIRQNKWNSVVTAKVGKPTVLFTSDDVSSKRQMTVEMTATPVR